MFITVIEGRELDSFLASVGAIPNTDREIYKISINQTHTGKVKIKINEGMWSPDLGQPLPTN